jgi:hypothetical protein
VTANRAASGAALGAAFHIAPGLATQRRVQPASGLSSESTRPRLLRRLDPDADVLPTPADSRLSWLKGRIRSIDDKSLGTRTQPPLSQEWAWTWTTAIMRPQRFHSIPTDSPSSVAMFA